MYYQKNLQINFLNFTSFPLFFQVEDHFASSHQEENFDMTNAINKCQNCYQGPFPTFTELLKHLAFNHPESIGKKCALNKLDQFILNAGHYLIKY